jgi:predicted nucleic acid-binding protein
LTTWLNEVKVRFKGRVAPIDEAIAESAGQMRGEAARRGRTVGALDSLIAATAASRALSLVTRNVRDFEALDVATLNPWSG